MGKHKYVLLIYMIVMAGFLVSCKTVIFDGKDKPLPTTPASKLPAVSDNKKEEAEKQPEKPVQESETGKQQETVTNAVEPSPTPVMMPEEVQKPTPEPSPTPTPEPSPTATATPTPGPITAQEAKVLLVAEIGDTYEAEADGEVSLTGSTYYLFRVSDGIQVYYPQIAVCAESKEMFYYYSSDEMEELTNFPPDNLENIGGEDEENRESGFTSEDAVALLNGLSAEELGLPTQLREYTILVDEWTTVVYGTECFCVNAYAELENRKQLMGVFFVAVDGSAAYRSDMGDFILIY